MLVDRSRLENGLDTLRRRATVEVNVTGSENAKYKDLWILGDSQANQAVPHNELLDLWYEALHLDAASCSLIPVVKDPVVHQLTLKEMGLCRGESRFDHIPAKLVQDSDIPNPQAFVREYGVIPEEADLVFLTSYPDFSGRARRKLIYFEDCCTIAPGQEPYIQRFYQIAENPQKVHHFSGDTILPLLWMDQLAS